MNALQRIYKNITKAVQTSADNALFGSLYWWLGNRQPITYDENFESYIENGYRSNSTLYSIVSFLSEKAASVPFKIVRVNEYGQYEEVNSPAATKLRKLLNSPNKWQSNREFMEQLFGFYFVTGNGYAYAPRLDAGANKGQTLELYVAPSQYMEIISGGWMNPVESYRLIYGAYDKRMPYDDVMHMKKANLNFEQGSEWYGQSPLKAGNKILSKSNSAEDAQMYLYQNRGVGGIISSDGNQLTPFTDEQAQQLRNTYKQKYSGPTATGEPMFTAAQIKWQSIIMNSKELGFDVDHNMTLRDMCNLYHVPSQLFGDPENQTYSNLNEARKAIYTDAIQPALDAFWDEFNRWLTPSFDENILVVPDYSQIPELQADKKQTVETMRMAVEAGIATQNEAREAMGLPLVDNPGADELYVSIGRVPLGYSDMAMESASEEALKRLGIQDF